MARRPRRDTADSSKLKPSPEAAADAFELAHRLWDAGKPGAAAELFAQGAAANDASCQVCLGVLYDTGSGVTMNTVKARRLYAAAMRNGEPSGAFNIGVQHRDSGNVRRARHWFRRAAEAGYKGAHLELGRSFLGTSHRRASWHLRRVVQAVDAAEADREEALALLASIGIRVP